MGLIFIMTLIKRYGFMQGWLQTGPSLNVAMSTSNVPRNQPQALISIHSTLLEMLQPIAKCKARKGYFEKGDGSSYVEWLLLVESAQQDLGLQQTEPQ
jgi:hypothetical protein